jgi:hypothetical protein
LQHFLVNWAREANYELDGRKLEQTGGVCGFETKSIVLVIGYWVCILHLSSLIPLMMGS